MILPSYKLLCTFLLVSGVSMWAQDIRPDVATEPIVKLLGRLTSREGKVRREAAKELERRQDASVIPGLVELLRFPTFNQYGEFAGTSGWRYNRSTRLYTP